MDFIDFMGAMLLQEEDEKANYMKEGVPFVALEHRG